MGGWVGLRQGGWLGGAEAGWVAAGLDGTCAYCRVGGWMGLRQGRWLGGPGAGWPSQYVRLGGRRGGEWERGAGRSVGGRGGRCSSWSRALLVRLYQAVSGSIRQLVTCFPYVPAAGSSRQLFTCSPCVPAYVSGRRAGRQMQAGKETVAGRQSCRQVVFCKYSTSTEKYRRRP